METSLSPSRPRPVAPSPDRRERAEEALWLGLDFCLRNQLTALDTADCGRLPFVSRCREDKVVDHTTNWLSGIFLSVLLDAHAAYGEARYLDAARKLLRYLYSLQDVAAWHADTFGAIHEAIPYGDTAHPRDALSAATGMLDYALATGCGEARHRAVLFGDWFVDKAMASGYPAWTVHFAAESEEPRWHGSFHAGSAFFLVKLADATGRAKFRDAAGRILDFYNRHMLADDGDITVILDRDTLAPLDDCASPRHAPAGWIQMHKYNDDFGALANLAFGRATGDRRYFDAAMRFLGRMRRVQRADGGFGPVSWADPIPSAAGVVLQETIMARRLGVADASFDAMAASAVDHLLRQQYRRPGAKLHGAFHGMDGETYRVDADCCNGRATAYALMALLAYLRPETRNYAAAPRPEAGAP